MRRAEIKRKTNETDITLTLLTDGQGKSEISSGNGFFDHMLALLAKHAGFDLAVCCKGDTEVDFHHSAEDIGICLGRAVKEALGDMRGIARYSHVLLPMDEALILCALDISGRGRLYCELSLPSPRVGDFDSELCREFLDAFAANAGITLHIKQLEGTNTHHIIEGVFKALARCLKAAMRIEGDTVPSTKGIL